MKRATWIVAIAGAGLAGIAGTATGAVIVEYAFTGNTLAPTTAIAGVSASNFADGPGLAVAPPQTDGTGFNTTVNGSPARYVTKVATNPSNSAATSLANGDYFVFTVSGTGGNRLDLTSLTFDGTRNNSGVGNGALYTSVDNYAAIVGSAWNLSTGVTSVSIDLSGLSFQGLSSITFRIVPWPAGYSSTGPTYIGSYDNVKVNGTVIPEPGTLAAVALGGLALLRRRRT